MFDGNTLYYEQNITWNIIIKAINFCSDCIFPPRFNGKNTKDVSTEMADEEEEEDDDDVIIHQKNRVLSVEGDTEYDNVNQEGFQASQTNFHRHVQPVPLLIRV